jgi:hypothetical protein
MDTDGGPSGQRSGGFDNALLLGKPVPQQRDRDLDADAAPSSCAAVVWRMIGQVMS